MSDGTRTRDHLDHNQVLYQLSYTHHVSYRIRPSAGRLSNHSDEGQLPEIGPITRLAAALAVSESGPGCGTNTVCR